MFSSIPNKNLSKIDFDPNPFGNDSIGTIKYVVPVQDLRNLSINWTIPDYRDQYESSPPHYLSHLIGHEGKGSLLTELKKRGWCNSLYAGSRRECRGFQFFNVTVDLSEEGGENIEKVIELVYQYINMVKSQEPSKRVFNEFNDLGKITFTFKDKENPISYVSSLAADLHIFTMEHILSGNYYLTKYDPNLIQSLFDYLSPDKMRVTAISKKYEGKTENIEKWYGTEYKIEKLSTQFLNKIKSYGSNDAFHLPSVNEFIPENLNLVSHALKADEFPRFPRVVYTSPISRLWYKEDIKFLLPKAVVKLELRNPQVYYNPINVNMTNMFVDLLLDSLNEILYPAELAGLKYNINTTSYGLNMAVSGFSDKIDRLIETLFDYMINFKVNPDRFKVLKERVKKFIH